MALRTLEVHTPDGKYPIYVGTHLLDQIPSLLQKHGLRERNVIVTTESLAPIYGNHLAGLIDSKVISLPDGEASKTLNSVCRLYDAFSSAGLDRKSVVIALGGGVIGDTAGFAAATYLRGLPFVQVPTSLLAMVDSSVGGKTGVNLPQGKNLVGAFKQPEFVVIDTDVLKTLPDVERRAGLAEVIKHGLLADPSLLEPAQYAEPTPDFVARAVQVKINVVEEDPYEHNIRAFLNLGHTFAHAIESVSHYTWRHGDAVAVGLVAALRLSHKLGLCDAELPERIERLLRDTGLPTTYRDYVPGDLRAAMNADKKRKDNHVRFVLLGGIGRPTLVDDVPDVLVLQVLESLRENRLL